MFPLRQCWRNSVTLGRLMAIKIDSKAVHISKFHVKSCRVLRSSICCGWLSEKNNGCKESVLMTPPCRWKGKKGSSKTAEKDLQSDDEDEERRPVEDEDWTKGKDSKTVNLVVTSLRTDLLLKASLNMARNKVETLFYESKIRVNGKKLLKKSSPVHVGDEIDVLRGPSPDNPSQFIIVTRIEVLSATERDTERLTVRVRRYPKLTIEDYDD